MKAPAAGFRLDRSCIFVVILLLLLGTQTAMSASHVVIVYPDSSKNTLRTISGLSWKLGQDAPDLQVEQYYLTAAPLQDRTKMEKLQPDLLITIGTKATAFADQHFPNLPVIFAKVLNPIESGFIQSWEHPGGHITGASLDIPITTQMQKFSAIIPNLKKVGVIYTERTERLVSEAASAVGQLGITLVSYKVASVKELPAAIDSLCRSVDGIWTVADEQLSSPQFIRYALLETLRNGKPVMGFSRSFVESGALFCLEPDYKYIGRQAADLALAVLNGVSPSQLPPTAPDIVYLYLNLKTEKLLNLSVPPELVDIAKETY